jgi:hypothetical protein
MSDKLFVFTASGGAAYKHYIDTIEEGFTLDKIVQFLSENDLKILRNIFGDRKIRAWGATPGSGNIRNWNNLETNDRILIYRKGTYEYVATIIHKTHNPELAKFLWGTDSSDQTWEYMYFLNNLRELSVPVSDFNEVVDYSPNYVPQGFNPISGDKLTPLIENFGSIDEFLNYLEEGRWIEVKKDIKEDVKKEIIKEKISKQVSHTEILEENLENIIAENIQKIDPHLKIVDRQKVTDVGRLDLLCSNEDYVVVELKKSKAGSSIIDQISRYMGWVKKHIAEKEGRRVRGIIVVGKKDSYLEYAAAANPLIEVKVFSISFSS